MTEKAAPSDQPPGTQVTPASAGKKPLLPETTEGMPWVSTHEIKKESNPFTDRDWRMWAYAWSGFTVRMVIIIGGIFSVYQYLATAEEKRINGTFTLLETWDRPEYQEAQLAVRQRIGDLNKKYANLLGKNPTKHDLDIFMQRVGLEAMTEDGGSMPLDEFKAHFDRLVYMLNRVATCVQAGQCSVRLTDDYFRDLSVSYWNYFSAYTKQVREGGSVTYSAPIEEYVTGKRPNLNPFFSATANKAP